MLPASHSFRGGYPLGEMWPMIFKGPVLVSARNIYVEVLSHTVTEPDIQRHLNMKETNVDCSRENTGA